MSKKQRLIALRQKLQTQTGIECYLSGFTEAFTQSTLERVCPEAFCEPYIEANNNKKQRLTAHQLRLAEYKKLEAMGIWLIY